MNENRGITRILIDHFFRRFFDNDTIQVDGDTQTTVVRALAIVAVPGLMVAFFLQNQYSLKTPYLPSRIDTWGAIGDQYFFVLFAFVVMGGIAIFEWEMLFPDRLDLLILTPLPIKATQMLAAKAAALLGFFTIFLVGSNFFGMLFLPAISHGPFFRHVYAHAVATVLAGSFAALLILALGGVLLCVLDAASFRIASPMLQMMAAMALTLLMLHYLRFGDSMQSLLSQPLGFARWMPTVWFLGLYEQLLHGAAAPPFAAAMARYALRATALAGAIVLTTYPLAWARMRRMAMEGGSRRRRKPSGGLTSLIHRIVTRPAERAVFHFIGQTMARNNRYQVYLALYCGTGLGLAISCATTFQVTATDIRAGTSSYGLHALLPLLLFWVIAGLRSAFAFPLNLPAGWIFRVTGVDRRECAGAARKWALLAALAITGSVFIALCILRWDMRHLLVQLLCGLLISLLLTDAFFSPHHEIPFNEPRMPGRANFPLMLTLYIGVLPIYTYGVIYLEQRLEMNLLKLIPVALTVVTLHAVFADLRGQPLQLEEELEGYEGEFQILGLS
jgi:hypothetical protein